VGPGYVANDSVHDAVTSDAISFHANDGILVDTDSAFSAFNLNLLSARDHAPIVNLGTGNTFLLNVGVTAMPAGRTAGFVLLIAHSPSASKASRDNQLVASPPPGPPDAEAGLVRVLTLVRVRQPLSVTLESRPPMTTFLPGLFCITTSSPSRQASQADTALACRERNLKGIPRETGDVPYLTFGRNLRVLHRFPRR
jgi:hypothetical protein